VGSGRRLRDTPGDGCTQAPLNGACEWGNSPGSAPWLTQAQGNWSGLSEVADLCNRRSTCHADRSTLVAFTDFRVMCYMNCAATNTNRPQSRSALTSLGCLHVSELELGIARDATTRDVRGAQAAASRGLGQTVVPTIERVAPVVTSAMSERNLESPG
jgi:hypothetical protein